MFSVSYIYFIQFLPFSIVNPAIKSHLVVWCIPIMSVFDLSFYFSEN